MTEKMEVYKCEICGNIVEMVHGGKGELICCGAPMSRLEAKTEDEGREKHVPVVEETDTGIRVRVGDVPHPMEEQHHIEWIEVIDGDTSCRTFLSAGDTPEAKRTNLRFLIKVFVGIERPSSIGISVKMV